MSFRVILSQEIGRPSKPTSREIPGKSQENPWKKISQKISRKFTRKMLVQKIRRKIPRKFQKFGALKFHKKSQKNPRNALTSLHCSSANPIVLVIFIEWCDFELRHDVEDLLPTKDGCNSIHKENYA